MRLKKKQRKAVIKWVAEGLESGEIIKRAAFFKPAFAPSRQQVQYYRKKTKIDLEEIRKRDKDSALAEGYALKGDRVDVLKRLADRLESDILGNHLWLEQRKGIGSGEDFQVIDYLEFNDAEVKQFRGTLDDIAKEVGDRIRKLDHTTDGEKIQSADPKELSRSMTALADALKDISGK